MLHKQKTTMQIKYMITCLLLIPGNYLLFSQEILQLKDRRELFVDRYLIHQLTGLELELHAPEDKGPVLAFDQAWEGQFSGYCTIIHDGDLYKAYYRGLPVAGSDGSLREVSCYAESTDGIHWQKPELNLFELSGTKKNNIILANAAPVTHNFSPFLDKKPDADPRQRYKALGGTKKSGLIAWSSPDGIHWSKLQEEPVIKDGIFDSQNVAFWSESEQKYVCYFRTWSGEGYSGFRSVSRATSDDFIHWSATKAMHFGDSPPEHIYTQQTHPYYRAPHIYLAIGARFMPGRQVLSDEQAKVLNVDPGYYKDCSDAFLMSSRGSNSYDRTFMESFIRPGIGAENWVSRSNYPALNVVQTSPEEMSVYVNEHYAQPTAHLRRYALRIDGFASLSADYEGGEMLSKYFTFQGNRLEINYATSAAGGIKIAFQDKEGRPMDGFLLENADEIIGNEISRVVSWNGNRDISRLSGQSLRMRIVMKDADLYSLRFFRE